MKKYLSILTVFISFQISFCQDNPQTLMTIDGREISKDEFLRIYNKNKDIAEDQQKSVDEYIDLFINYKLKVIEAENLGYDTMSSFLNEMNKYTKQLTDPYLENEEVLDSLVVEVYNRSLEEVNASHILFKISHDGLPKDSFRIYNRLMKIRERLVSGESFHDVVDDESRNPDNKIGSDLGWFTAFRMVYPFEEAAYNTPVGEVTMPVKTDFGYHLIKVNDRRKNRGEVNASHIMTTLPKESTELEKEAAKQKIEKAYAELQQGTDWNEVAIKYSEHRGTASRGGSLGWLSSVNAPEIILDSCFAIDSGTFSQPFLSKYGYHIVKVTAYKPLPSFEDVKEDYKRKLRNTSDVKRISEKQVLDKIKSKHGFEFIEENIDTLYSIVDTSIIEKNWDPELAKDLNEPVFRIGDRVYNQYEIAKHLTTVRRGIRVLPLDQWIRKTITNFANEEVLNYERDLLPSMHSDLKYLLEEYHDGILLFNLTEDIVWQKAIEDSLGLKKFYNELPEKYSWEERISISKYTYADSSLIQALLKTAKVKAKKNLSAEQISFQICPQDSVPCLKVVEMKYEKGDNAVADSLTWKKGSYLTSRNKDKHVLYYVDAILPAQTKQLNDARGLYTADYQSFLEKQWIEELRNKYTIKIDEEILNDIKSQEQ